MKIELLTSKNESQKETGFGSKQVCESVSDSLERMGHSVKVTVCKTLEDLKFVVKRNPDFVVLAAKYITIKDDENVWFSDYLAQNDIVFSGSSRETLNYDSDKILAKKYLTKLGIKTAKFFTATPDQYRCKEDLPISFPLFIKPIDTANGIGIDDCSYVEDFTQFRFKVASLYEIFKQPLLVEEYLNGKEFTVAIIEDSNGELSVSGIEIVAPESIDGLRILGALAKSSNLEALKQIEIHDALPVIKIALSAFLGLGVRGFGRIDVKMDSYGTCYFMEANLVPGMNKESSYFPRAFEIARKMSFDDTIKLMLDECMVRANLKRSYQGSLN